jgi:putative membrane protein
MLKETCHASSRQWILAIVLCLAATGAMAQYATKPNDRQIAQFVYTAWQTDIASADIALKKTHNTTVKAFANKIIRGSAVASRNALALLDKLKATPEVSDISASLAGAAAEKQQELSKLSGAAFDKAYAEHQLAYWVTVNGALETTLIPSMQNAELKRVLETSLALFKEHQKRAEQLINALE